MRTLLCLTSAAILLVALSGPASAAPVFVYDGGVGNGTWKDVNKTSTSGDPDSLMCWAASASNALAWTEWYGWCPTASSLITNEIDMYAVFVNDFPANRVSSAIEGHMWWFTCEGGYYGHTVWPSAGKGFYDLATFEDNANWWPFGPPFDEYDNVENAILEYVNADRGISMSIEGTYGHTVTVWGIDTAENEVYITDSDDGVTDLRTYGYYESGGYWYLEDYENLYTSPTDMLIKHIARVNLNVDGIQPNQTGCVIPEPATLLLFGVGLAGLGYRLRRRRL
jgi:hypothetical protein